MGFEDECALEGVALSGSQESGHEALGQYTNTDQNRRHPTSFSLKQELFGCCMPIRQTDRSHETGLEQVELQCVDRAS